jgi:hypothetical protein
MTTWTNSDGLRVNFGLDEAKKARAGSPMPAGAFKTYEFDIVGTELGSASAFINGSYTVIIPAGAIVQNATLITEVIFTGSSSTLNLGLAKINGDTYDADGIDATIALTAIDAVGETVACDGALVGVALAHDSVLVADYDTAAFTAGRGKLIVNVLIPDA